MSEFVLELDGEYFVRFENQHALFTEIIEEAQLFDFKSEAEGFNNCEFDDMCTVVEVR